jgi:hypothetical protein
LPTIANFIPSTHVDWGNFNHKSGSRCLGAIIAGIGRQKSSYPFFYKMQTRVPVGVPIGAVSMVTEKDHIFPPVLLLEPAALLG